MGKRDRTLTKKEYEIMSIMWDIHSPACAWDIQARFDDPKPAYTTIATYLKILYEKGYVDYFKNKGEGKTFQYVPKITREEYTRAKMQEVKKTLFDGSLKSMLSFFVKDEQLSIEEIKDLLDLIKQED